MTEQAQRAAVVAEALTWLNTPYHHMGRVKGAGVDCGMLIAEVFERAGLIPHLDIGYYPMDWHLHRGAERYLCWVSKYANEVQRDPLPGDIVLHQWGRCISHGAIVIKWPMVIHSYIGQGVVLADGTKEPLAGRQRAIHSFWG
ncbi:NlpC/P60 family protein [Anaeromusa acidaminophila]|uniref:NlpC/P60 family protein n=1 Tax=Anaeromusa acidaminophila TaxID=81464 RepID=UPI00037B1451|nr:NlpC/P60 family protein [Anaeromusa acidaminophila]